MTMRTGILGLCGVALLLLSPPAIAGFDVGWGPFSPPLVAPPRSNTLPLRFGMSAGEASSALRTQLHYVKGKPGNEVYLAIHDVGGTVLSHRVAHLYLQFRKGRLTGWKADWTNNWMWQ